MKIKSSYRLPLLIAILAHLVLVVVFSINAMSTHYRWRAGVSQLPAIHAKTIDQKQLTAQINKIRWEKATKQREALEHLRNIEHKALLAKNKRYAEEQRVRAIEKTQAELLSKQKKQKHQMRVQQHKAEEKARELQKQIRQIQVKKLASRQEYLQEKMMRDQLHSDQKQLALNKSHLVVRYADQQKGLIDKYRAQILQAIQNNWHPLVQDPKLCCQLLVHVGPGGVVTKAEILRSSTNRALDRSARLAVLKSSPLPVPKEAHLFDRFRQLRINMTPQDVKGMRS